MFNILIKKFTNFRKKVLQSKNFNANGLFVNSHIITVVTKKSKMVNMELCIRT